MPDRYSTLALAALAFSAPAAPAAAQPAPMDLSHLRLAVRVASPEVSADGGRVAYAAETPAPDGESMLSEIKVVTLADGKTTSLGEGSAPRFSPDGRRVAFLRASEGGEEAAETDLFLHDLESGRSERLATIHPTDHFLGHEADRGFAWSPDGKAIAFCGAEEPAPPEGGIQVVSRLLYKTRTGFSDNRRTHLWVVPVEGEGRGKPRLLTPGRYDEHSLSWSPDGRRLAFTSNRAKDPDDHYADDLFVVEVATGEVRRLTETPGTEMHPAFSPDGARVAYLATRRPLNTRDSPVEDPRLLVIPAAGGEAVDLAPEIDRRIDEILWLPDGRGLLALVQDRGRTPILRLALPPAPLSGGKAASSAASLGAGTVTPERFLEGYFRASSLSVDRAGGTLVYLRSGFAEPGEVYATRLDNRASRRLTGENRRLANRVELRDADTLAFESPDGTKVAGWVVKPARFQAGRRYPAVLWIHGGPHGMFGYGFSERVQMLAGAGYGVILINPRGSTGYGQEFADGTLEAWGGGDYQDLMAGVDAALRKFPWLDGERLGVGGASYGGFMTNWVITQTDRFKAAIAIASLSNLVSFYGTSLYQDLMEVEFGGRPWEGDNFAELWKWSPLAHVAKARTPTLFLHGVADHDVPITQAEEMYMALRKRGIESVLVRYPDEGHSLRKPNHQRDSYQRILAWFDRFLKAGTAPGAAAPARRPR